MIFLGGSFHDLRPDESLEVNWMFISLNKACIPVQVYPIGAGLPLHSYSREGPGFLGIYLPT